MNTQRSSARLRISWCAAFLLPGLLGSIPNRAHVQAADLAASVHPACSTSPVDTTGWQVERMVTTDGWHFLYRHPPSFVPKPNVRFEHGGRVYVDGNRTLIDGMGYVCIPGPEAVGCSECVDTIAGYPFVLTSNFQNGLYHVAATRLHANLADHRGLHLTSPDSADQNLFVAIVRTIEERSRISALGSLFLGGHEMRAPFVLTCPEGRLAVNGYWMPDLVPSGARRPNPNAELESRRAVAARIASERDRLLASGLEWTAVQERMRATALTSPFVKSVHLSRTDSTLADFSVSWAFGYTATILSRRSGTSPISMGGSAGAFEEDWRFWTARLDYLKRQLDLGAAVFLLGGGCEYIVDPADAAPAVQAARRVIEGRPLREPQSAVLPSDVLAQLRKPLALDRAQKNSREDRP